VIIPDVNLLLYATVTGFAHHERSRSWLEGALNGTTPIGLAMPAIFGYLRIATSSRVLASPMPVTDALERVRSWLAEPVVTVLVPGPRYLDIAFDLLESLGTGANLTTDVQLAALAIEQVADVYSTDADFGRFPDLSWVNPLKQA
jgi:toxin-antitoxin system PIN domain toxin